VRGAWRTLKRDPVKIGLPAAGLLLLDVAVAIGIRELALSATWEPNLAAIAWFLGPVAALELCAFLVGVPLRAAMIAAGARALGREVNGLARAPALLGVALAIGSLRVALTAVLGTPAILLVIFVAGHGWYGLAAAGLALAILAIGVLRFGVRVLFGYAPILAVADGAGSVRALQEGPPGSDALGVGLVLFIGDSATVLGSLCCGAGALPGYPLADLAILHRWHNELPDPPPPDPVV